MSFNKKKFINKNGEERVYNKETGENRYLRYFYRENGKTYYMSHDKDDLNCHADELFKDDGLNKYNYFELFDGYKGSKEGIIKYMKDFKESCDTLLKDGIFYKKYYNHKSAATLTFVRFSNMKKNSISINNKKVRLENINFKESYVLEKCHNAGLCCLDEKYKDDVIKCYGYDYGAFYPHILSKSDLKIATTKPEFKKLSQDKFMKKLSKGKLKYGVYNVKITIKECNNKTSPSQFYKKFSFSSDDWYTHIDLSYAYSQKDNFELDFKINEQTKDYNTMIYDKDDLIDSKVIFESWYDKLKSMKDKNKNMLIKHLMSSIWGYLCEHKKLYYNQEEFMKLDDEDVSDTTDKHETKYKILKEKMSIDSDDNIKINFTLIDKEEPYKYNIARMKPFLMSYCRCFVAEMIDREGILNDIIRIHTDGIVLNRKHEFKDEYKPLKESKTTGNILWKNTNTYFHKCKKCKRLYSHRTNKLMGKDEMHEC